MAGDVHRGCSVEHQVGVVVLVDNAREYPTDVVDLSPIELCATYLILEIGGQLGGFNGSLWLRVTKRRLRWGVGARLRRSAGRGSRRFLRTLAAEQENGGHSPGTSIHLD